MNKTTLIVQTDDVSVTTVSVTLQVVRIGVKQMTLSVFRQLPIKNIFQPDGRLVGPPWGWVNYDRSGLSEYKPFIFSDEGVLYRYDVDLTAYYREPYIAPVQTKNWSYMDGETWTPTGKWAVATKIESTKHIGNLNDLQFPSEEAGKVYLREWMKSAAVLDAAPQLFIGV